MEADFLQLEAAFSAFEAVLSAIEAVFSALEAVFEIGYERHHLEAYFLQQLEAAFYQHFAVDLELQLEADFDSGYLHLEADFETEADFSHHCEVGFLDCGGD